MRPLLFLLPVEEAPCVRIEFPDVLKHRHHAINRPRVGVQIVLHRDVFVHSRRNVIDPWNAGDDAVHIIQGELHLHARFLAARLFAGPSRENADDVGAPLRENRLDRAAETCSIGQQQHHRRNPPRHPDHGDGGATAVVNHRLPGLT